MPPLLATKSTLARWGNGNLNGHRPTLVTKTTGMVLRPLFWWDNGRFGGLFIRPANPRPANLLPKRSRVCHARCALVNDVFIFGGRNSANELNHSHNGPGNAETRPICRGGSRRRSSCLWQNLRWCDIILTQPSPTTSTPKTFLAAGG